MYVVFVELIQTMLRHPHMNICMDEFENEHQLDIRIKVALILKESGLINQVDDQQIFWKNNKANELSLEALYMLRFLDIKLRDYLIYA